MLAVVGGAEGGVEGGMLGGVEARAAPRSALGRRGLEEVFGRAPVHVADVRRAAAVEAHGGAPVAAVARMRLDGAEPVPVVPHARTRLPAQRRIVSRLLGRLPWGFWAASLPLFSMWNHKFDKLSFY